ncbi:MAG TPA: DUF4136 domain-containing protein [Nitrospira sp.]|nr:DUF4136 domain-containing protein [Nitrospira sp.]
MMPWNILWSCVLFMLAFITGCSSSIYGWQVRTSSTVVSPSFGPGMLGQEPVAVLGALTMPGLRGNEVALDYMLAEILHRVAPQIQIVRPQHSVSQINQQGLTPEYTQMRTDAEQSHILNRDSLRKIGAAIGARFVFQPRLAAFTQIMYDRWTFPALGVVISQTRQCDLRMSVQLWDAKTGELLWASMAEGTMQSEAFAKDPVYLEDAMRVTMGSIIADFVNRKTASTYTPLNKIVDQLIQIPLPEAKSDGPKSTDPPSQ